MMKNPLIVDGEILLCDEDIFLFVREKAGDEVANEIQRIIDDLRIENEEYKSEFERLDRIEMETRSLIRQIETDQELNRTALRNQAMKIFKITIDL